MTSTFEQSEIRRGSKVGRFVVVGELGSGGMGVVYAAHDRELDRHVALKVMRGVLGDDEDRVRMLREGQAMARVSHPNVITVFEVGTHGGIVFLAQELLDAGTLGSWLEQPRSEAEILDKFIAAGRGLAAAHAAGLVHRDFKPENVLLGKDGRVRVSDFGLARATGVLDGNQLETVRGGRSVEHSHAVSPMTNNLTRTGAVMGTPMFMAPEQHEGRRADERSDQFAFCVALYHALYGAWPFDGKTSVALADNVINGVMKPPPKTAKVSPRLRKILLRGLSTKPEDRYPSMDAMLAELTARPGGTRKRLVVAGVLLAAAAGAALFIATRRDTPAAVVEAPRPMPVIPQSELDPKSITYAIDHGT
ncbi:MAG TPA: serine/threonine-protein kinase, partial [Kofleriaceae bacterium]|nr:serine/threonine-protein kinase [Kofleriaceae bacterium]